MNFDLVSAWSFWASGHPWPDDTTLWAINKIWWLRIAQILQTFGAALIIIEIICLDTINKFGNSILYKLRLITSLRSRIGLILRTKGAQVQKIYKIFEVYFQISAIFWPAILGCIILVGKELGIRFVTPGENIISILPDPLRAIIIFSKAYPSGSGGTKCGDGGTGLAVEHKANIIGGSPHG